MLPHAPLSVSSSCPALVYGLCHNNYQLTRLSLCLLHLLEIEEIRNPHLILVPPTPTVVGKYLRSLVLNQTQAELTRVHKLKRCSMFCVLPKHSRLGHDGSCALRCSKRRCLVGCILCIIQNKRFLYSVSRMLYLSQGYTKST